jgi:hypothetical protein
MSCCFKDRQKVTPSVWMQDPKAKRYLGADFNHIYNLQMFLKPTFSLFVQWWSILTRLVLRNRHSKTEYCTGNSIKKYFFLQIKFKHVTIYSYKVPFQFKFRLDFIDVKIMVRNKHFCKYKNLVNIHECL